MMSCKWKPARQKYGVAVSNFRSAAIHSALPLQIGDTVHVLEEYWADANKVTWLRGCVCSNKNKKGVFPLSFIAFKECTVENEGPYETVIPVEDAIIKELTYVLREWNVRWKTLFVDRKSIFQTISLVMGELDKIRSLLVSNTLTREQALEQKHSAITMIDWGNGQLGMDLVPRVDYQQADPDKVSVVEMFRIHEQSVKNCQGALPGGMVKVKAREKQGEKVYHLLVGICSLACAIGDNGEVYLSLYDNTDGRFLSERFVMTCSKNGNINDRTSNTIFSDLSPDETRKDIYLVLQILRKGRLTAEGSFKKLPAYQYRRPWGVSVLSLKDLFQINPENELEYFLRVHCVDNENFATTHESLIKRQIAMVGKGSVTDRQNQGVTLSVKILHGDLKTVRIENPILFTRGVVLTQRMGFPEFITPGEMRNDLYLTLVGAEFDRGSKTASKNVEVRITVFNQNYETIEDCILPANGIQMSSVFYSYVLYHSNAPKWNETIRLSIPIEKFNGAHIRLELCHCSNRDKAEKKMYGFAYLSVTTQGNVTRHDGRYELCIYKCEDAGKVKNYLRFPSLKEEFSGNPDAVPYQHSSKEYVTVETFLCSSKFAQKSALLNVLQWRSNPSKIPQHLDNLIKLKGQELVRYLQDILDSLFDMFNAADREQVPFAMDIFQTLVHIFNLLHEDIFEKFSAVLDDYLEKSFSSPLAHRDLMLCLKVQAERIYTCTDFDDKSTRKVFKVLGDIFKFAVKSCILSQRVYTHQLVDEFKRNLHNVFQTFGDVLRSTEKVLHKAQALLLNNLHKCFIPLLHILSVTDLTKYIRFLLCIINKEPGVSVTKAKTMLIQHAINSKLMTEPASRVDLLPICLADLKKCLYKKLNLELVTNTLGDLLTSTYKLKDTCDIKDEVAKIIQSVFDVTVITLWTLNSENSEQRQTAGSLLVACLTEMLRLMDVSHYQKLMGVYQKPTDLKMRLSIIAVPLKSTPAVAKDFLNRVLIVFRDLIKTNNFPVDWTTMRMITNNVMLTSIQYIADDLTVNFLHGSDFDREMWYNFFLLAVDFITQPALQLEKYSEAKSSQIKDKYNDMRVPVGFHIYTLWNQLGANKHHLTMEMIGPFLKVTMVPQAELRKATIPIFFDIIQCEFKLKGDLKRVEGKMIYELDSLVLDHHGDGEYKKLLSSILLDKVQAEPELQEEGKRFVFSVTDLLERLLDYRDIMDREEQRDTKMHCTFNILNFYKDSRRDMYIRYISRLYELHYTASNFVEAGLTLKLYAQLLSWSQTKLPKEMNYPSETEAQRKEELFTRIMDCFDKGKAWEYGIPLCKELADHYEKTFQYQKLGQILQKQASFFYQILEGNKLRQDPTYYRVAYYGNTFPPYLKNKAFIYRGDECLKLSTIMSQLTREYPSAVIMTTNSPIDDSYKQGDAQCEAPRLTNVDCLKKQEAQKFKSLVSVKPVPSDRPEFVGKEVPSEVSAFYNTNEVDTFQFDRPHHRDDKDKNNEFKSLCLERTIMRSSYHLPGILRWYEVVSTKTVHFCPVQTAHVTVQQMNAELRSSADNALRNPEQCLNHLTMRLQGVISGAVNGGIPKYQEAFFNEEYLAKYPDEAEYVDQLKAVILEQIQLLEKGLNIQGRYASQEMQPLHHSLVDMFTKMKSSMGYQNTSSNLKNRVSSLSNGSQRPSTPSSTSLNSSGSNRSSVISAGDVDPDEIYVEPPEPPSATVDLANGVSVNNEEAPPPPPPPPRKGSTAGIQINNNLPNFNTMSPPVLPTTPKTQPLLPGKQTRTSVVLNEKHLSSSSSDLPHTEDTKGKEAVPPVPPRTSGPQHSTTTSPLDTSKVSLDAPPIPNKRNTSVHTAPFLSNNFGGSTPALSPVGGYKNFNRFSTAQQSHSMSSSTGGPAPPPPRPRMVSARDPPPELVSLKKTEPASPHIITASRSPMPPPELVTFKQPASSPASPPAITTPSPTRNVPPPAAPPPTHLSPKDPQPGPASVIGPPPIPLRKPSNSQ
ncbi:unnamed protein product [Lymnaea stagnalis]|uniref:Dedicator of cytokinesis protein 1 n=1 Tax=Lymnaea stagnalis TaxID=6523 RepID=A0AAV2GZG9_LYMST